LQHPEVMIASDAMPVISKKRKVTPRGIGTFSKVLEVYVREEKLLTLLEAINKMTYLPAKRMESIAPVFSKKGRIAIGAHADLVIFDADKIQAHGTYEEPYQASTGINHIFIGGIPVIQNGEVVGNTFVGKHLSLPGKALNRKK
jgi:N-acyl-D-aspartate/D-glutamate deacylase